MPRDFKIGLALGLILTAAIILYLATRPDLSIKTRMANFQSAEPAKTEIVQPPPNPQAKPPAEPVHTEPQISSSPEDTKEVRFHIVAAGETLSQIAYKYYGSAKNLQKILDANRDTIKKADQLRAGTRLIIPQ